MNIKFAILVILFLLVHQLPLISAPENAAINKNGTGHKTIDLEERIIYLTDQCRVLLEKSGWLGMVESNRIKAFRPGNRYDWMSVKIYAEYKDGFYTFTVAISNNGKELSKAYRLSENIVNNDDRLREIILSAVAAQAVPAGTTGDFRKSYSSILSFGYSRTDDGGEFYPAYAKGNLHLSWQLEYDPSAKAFSGEMPLTFGDYMSFYAYFDWANVVHENFFNIDLLIYGKNRYEGSPEHGTRILYGFFNGLEYFRPGFSDSTMKWDRPIYNKQPYIQYNIWRALQWNAILTRRDGSVLYTADLMLGAGMGIGPSSLFLAGTTEEEEQHMSHVFRSIRYRKQNYYFSYTLPAHILLRADRVSGFRLELGYNYYFFYPVLTDNLYDMLHIARGSIGYYISYDVMLSSQYECWLVQSMLHGETMRRYWNRLIIEFTNYF